MNVTAILLAAGTSTRMGKANKLFLPFHGKPLILHTLEALRSSLVREVIIVTNEFNEKLLPEAIRQSYKVVLNPDYQQGMTTSIQHGVRAASKETKGYMICLSDQPLLSASDYNLLLEGFSKACQTDPACIVLPFFQNQKGNPVIFSRYYREAILAHKQMEGCKAIVQQNKEHIFQQAMPTQATLIDIDTPEDYQRHSRS
jgi:molybdenum cofactor cytidylyltransferase